MPGAPATDGQHLFFSREENGGAIRVMDVNARPD
jgi:hypothetical protein